MRIYAERPGRVLLQLLADAAVLAWVYVVVQFAQAARDVVLQLQGPAGRLVGAGDAIRGAFDSAAATATTAGTAVLAAVVLLGVVPVVAVWLTLRVRWVRAASSARAARAADPDLLALQALTRRPTRRLLAVTPEPGAAWRGGDPDAVAALAAVELDALGLRSGGVRRRR